MLTGHIIPSLTVASLIGIRPLYKAGCKVLFDDEKCEVIFDNKVFLTGYKDASTDFWTLPLPTKKMRTTQTSAEPTLPQPGPCVGHAPHLLPDSNDTHPGINIEMVMHSVSTRVNTVKFAHQSLSSPKISSLLKAVRKGFLKGCPNMTEMLILKYLNPSMATAKGHMKCLRHDIQSTQPKPGRHASPTNVPELHFNPVPCIMPPVHLAPQSNQCILSPPTRSNWDPSS
jgi:hypothetical protein